MSNVFEKQSITADKCAEMVTKAIAKANEIGFGISITIVDESGVVKAFQRMDNAPMVSIDASRKKAVTAVGFGMPTGDSWYGFIKDDPISRPNKITYHLIWMIKERKRNLTFTLPEKIHFIWFTIF